MSITPASDIPISVNYTGRDYYSIREQLITQVQKRVNVDGQTTWTASNTADFAVALIEAFAYMGDLMSYYIDRNVNESFIATATQRESVLNIAQTYGYIPAGYRGASLTATFLNSSVDIINIPAGTTVSGDVVIDDAVHTLYFTVDSDTVSDPATDSGTVTALVLSGQSITQFGGGVTSYGELVGVSTATPAMTFELTESPVVDGSISVYVQDSTNYSKWTQVQHLIDYGPYNQVFTAISDENNVVSISFGDGVSGQIPISGSEVRALYSVGGGNISNISIGVLTDIVYVPNLTPGELSAFQAVITVRNDEVAVGGSDPESLNQIRYAAPIALRANNRAVTKADYSGLALQVGNVGKANATADVWSSVTLYLAPTRNSTETDVAPGLDGTGGTQNGDPTLEFTTMASDVSTFLEDKLLLGTSVTIQPPVYVDVVLGVGYTKEPQYTTAEVELEIKRRILNDFGYMNQLFEDTIHQQDLEFSLNQITGIKIAKVTALYRDGGSPAITTLIGTAEEIFRFQEVNMAVGEL
ncbi:Baseplate protein J-like [uncultured Caudovirales phage]|uniref:Baseplate protein J-like n=1 Tax=uncultured Caudovirales phage TaxID=2100421 RepID=A0A6J5Q5X2_9CAUD|nr:Baseplate protein J-like [uncultured Caudovirales phage]CAB4174215.1 Baseplate protein J-like [uncultured Caudovirales phage]CAB4179493.1 Baseplate protein J-like [uncultured Caudovirales phage]CAB4189169.1 Baseplate protein J-like [uncultured Caudovirales phage]CAB4193600.1 Baseplate protein J-like [uncultured Caudovirales phage]